MDAVENDQDQSYIVAQMDDAEKVEKKIKETFVTYCQRIQEDIAQSNQTNRTHNNDVDEGTNPTEMAINVRPKANLKNVHTKTIEMESDISLKDFEFGDENSRTI